MATLAVVALFLSLSVAEDVGLVEELHAAPKGKATGQYDKIAGFELKMNAHMGGGTQHFHVVMGKKLDACRELCSKANWCKSFSYRASKQECIVSPAALSYDPEFTLHVKREQSKGIKKYHAFPGLTLQSDGFLNSKGKTKKECRALCNKAATCKAYSYRNANRLCLISGKGVQYAPGFSYYEKNAGVFRLATKKSVPQPRTPPAPKKPCKDPTQSSAVVAMELKEKARLKQANGMMVDAKKQTSESKAKVAKLAANAKEKEKKAQLGEKGKLSKMESKFNKMASERMEKRNNQEKLKFAESEMRTKAEHKKNKLGREKERQQKKDDKIRARADREAARVDAKAALSADDEMKKILVARELKRVQAAREKQQKREVKTKAASKKSEAERKELEKREQEKVTKIKKELKKKKDVVDASTEVARKKERKRAEVETLQMKEKTNKITKESDKKHIISRTERGVKAAENAGAVEKAAKQRAQSATELREKRLAEADERRGKYERVRDAIIEAEKEKAIAIGTGKLKGKALETVAQTGMYNLKIDMAKQSAKESLVERRKLDETKESIRKKKRIIMQEAKRAAENLSKQVMKTEMDKKKPDRISNKERIKKDKAKLAAMRIKARHEARVQQAEIDSAMAAAKAVRTKVEREARARVAAAKQNANEITTKVTPKADTLVAKTEAKARLKVATAEERAVKNLKNNRKYTRRQYQIVETKIRADLAAYVDSGVGRTGTNEVALRDIMDKARSKMEVARDRLHKNDYQKFERIHKHKTHEENRRYHRENHDAHVAYHRRHNNAHNVKPQTNSRSDPEGTAGGPKGFNKPGFKKAQGQAQKNANAAQAAAQQKGQAAQNKNLANQMKNKLKPQELIQIGEAFSLKEKADKVKAKATAAANAAKKAIADKANAAKKAVQEKAAKLKGGNKNQAKGKCFVKQSRQGYWASGRRHRGSQDKVQCERLCTHSNCKGYSVYQYPRHGRQCFTYDTGNKGHFYNRRYETAYSRTNPCVDIARKKEEKERREKAAERKKKHDAHVERTNKERSRKKKERDQKAVAERKNKEQATKRRIRIEKERRAARVEYDKRRAANSKKHSGIIGVLNKDLRKRSDERHRLQIVYNKVHQAWHKARALHSSVAGLTSNRAHGKLPEMASHQGFLRIQSGYSREQYAFMKFPTRVLRGADTIVEGKLKLFKYGGYGGPATVKISSCNWSRGKLTYTRSLGLIRQRVSTGVTSKFPDAQNTWVEIKLRGGILNGARLAGSHICVAVEGGPAQSPCIISSELTRQAPELILDVREAQTPLKYGTGKGAKGKKKKNTESDAYREQLRQELTAKFTKETLAANVKEAKVKAGKITANMANNGINAKTKIAGAAAAKVVKQVNAQQSALMNAESKKIAAATAGTRGTQKIALQAQMRAQSNVDVAKKMVGIKQKVKAQVAAGVAGAQAHAAADQAKQQNALEAEKEGVMNKSAKLSPAQQDEVANKVNVELPKRMAQYMAGKSKPSEVSVTMLDADEAELEQGLF